MPDDLIFPVPDDFQGRAWIDHSTYRHEYVIRALIRHGEEAVKKTSRNRFTMYDIPSMA